MNDEPTVEVDEDTANLVFAENEREKNRIEYHKLLATYLTDKNWPEVIKLLDIVKAEDKEVWQELHDEMTDEEIREIELHRGTDKILGFMNGGWKDELQKRDDIQYDTFNPKG